MFNIVLYEPEIPPNTGNIMRLCAITGCRLHLIEPLGFQIDDKQLRRAGLDYLMALPPKQYSSFDTFLNSLTEKEIERVFFFTTKGKQGYSEQNFCANDYFVFGPETRGLPSTILNRFSAQSLRIPMLPEARSLNLSNAVAIVVYEAWRQNGFL